MSYLVNWCAPRGLYHGFLLFCVVQVLIQITALAFELGFFGVTASQILTEMTHTFVVSAPFLIAGLLILARQRELKAELVRLADHDPLTGLLNRRAFYRQAEDLTERAGHILVMIDVDHFKVLNDTHGHAMGDECLCLIAQKLLAIAGEKDLVARLGGEEFVLLLNAPSMMRAGAVAAALAEGVAAPAGEGLPIRATASVGVSVSAPGVPLDELLARADKALYRAKADGRARVATWSALGPIPQFDQLHASGRVN